jgi:uncharacterized repeat protein (TIGR03803 family)
MNVTPHSRIHRTVGALLIGCALATALCATSWAASEKVLYRFHGTDGWSPNTVVLGPDGALYGTTASGGTHGGVIYGGVVFELTHGADGQWHETVLHNFDGSDGEGPVGPLVFDKAGNLYGATVYGGPNGCSGLGCGVAFELERGRAGKWTFKILHLFFQQQGDGLQPFAGMIFDSKGDLFGTTHGGGNFACTGGCGVVYELSPDGKGDWTETVLYSFSGKDGEGPSAPLVFNPSGDLFGEAEYGGAHGGGTVFRLSLTGNRWSEEVLHSFSLDTGDGYEPADGLVFDPSGTLYGTTPFGGMKGAQGWGTAFKLTPSKRGKWEERILHRFDRAKFGGGYVSSGPVINQNGALYGAADWGGKYKCPLGGGLGCGVVFKLAPQSSGKWEETVLHSFGNGDDGVYPGRISLSSSGHLFGVAYEGGYAGYPCGTDGCGVVFEVTP